MELAIAAFETNYGAPEEVRYEFSFGDELIGVVSISSTKDYYFLHFITVMPEERGKGYGSLILEVLCEMFHDKPIHLELDASSPLGIDKLRTWYERHGFTFLGGEEMVRKPKLPS